MQATAVRQNRSKAHEAHGAICLAEKTLLRPIIVAKGIVNGKLDTYEREQKRIAEAKQREINERLRKEEEERKINEAIEAEAFGEPEAAAAILEERIEIPTVYVAPALAKVQGVTGAKLWAARNRGTTEKEIAANKRNLIEFVALAKGGEWDHLLEPDMPSLNSLAKSAHEGFNIPGFEAFWTTSRRTGAA